MLVFMIGGLVEAPREFSLADLKAMPKQEQPFLKMCHIIQRRLR